MSMNYELIAAGTPTGLTDGEIRAQVEKWLARYDNPGKVLILPPDISRLNSHAGAVVRMIIRALPGAEIEVMPALGTHTAMTGDETDRMYPGVPRSLFVEHRWREDVVHLGDVPGEFVREVSGGLVDHPIRVEINRRLVDPAYGLIVSVGQVVPHEVVGMANYNKNIFVGCGGSGMINGSHFLGAVYGMENMMGRDLTPVHRVFDYAEERFCGRIPLLYALTVTAPDATGPNVRSFAIGRDRAMFSDSIKVSQRFNLNFLDKPLKKVVAYLDPEEFHTTWIANKSIYRTRMAIADAGELIVIAPGVHRFGEDLTNDKLIRKYGYIGRRKVLESVGNNPDLAENLSVAAHLIHGSPDGRFTVTYAPGHLTREETESVGFKYLPLEEATAKYDPARLRPGFNRVGGEEIYFVPNPALGLWADRSRFENAAPGR
ncbi:MAG: nickel-dependent lactate racemase [Planctomycetota bacterium]|jgi:nickel-dependent lactate racemase|nr:nickel-dependent lactate racemase [Planctomycetota bacterium]